MRGRKNKPTKIKELHGTDRPDRRNTAEPKPKTQIPPCPRELGGVARKEWRRISKILAQLGLISTLDRATLTAYCSAWETFMEAEMKIRESGKVVMIGAKKIIKKNGDVETVGGYPQQNPWLPIRNKAIEQIRAFCAEFGMSPAARVRVRAEGMAEDDELAQWLKSKRGKTGTDG